MGNQMVMNRKYYKKTYREYSERTQLRNTEI